MAQRFFFLFFNVICVTAVSSLDWDRCCSHQRHVSQGGARVRNSAEVCQSLVNTFVHGGDGQRLAPQDVRLNWITDFQPQLSWEPPPHLPEGCCFCARLNSTQTIKMSLDRNTTESGIFEFYYTKDSSLNMSVQTICDNMTSEPVTKNNIYPELVTDLDCYILSRHLTRCTWSPVPGAPQSTFFFMALYGRETTLDLQPCPKVYKDHKRIVCDLHISSSPLLRVLFNGTVDNKTVRNTFKKELDVKPSFKSWTVTPVDSKFNVSWVTPDDADVSGWDFRVLYKECASSGSSNLIKDHIYTIDRLPSCRYCFAIQASFGRRKTKTEEKCFDVDQNIFLLAAIIVPLTCVALAVLALGCCIRNKDSMFPPIPKPRDLLSDISDNNNKTQFENIYFPSEVEELFKITLVTDPPIDKLKA